MGDRPSLYEDIAKLGKIVLMVYYEKRGKEEKRIEAKGSPEKIMEIYQKIQSNPDTLRFESIVPSE